MKKALTFVLTLALVLSLVSPAVAAEADIGIIGGADGPTAVFTGETDPIAVDAKTAAELAEKYGLEIPEDTTVIPTGDFGYSIKGADTPPIAGDYDDPGTVLELLNSLEGNYDWDYDDPAPTLTLFVNGAASSVEVTAEDGVTYADAVALRGILGTEGVPTDAEGPVAIRAAAEAAGWDVGWCNMVEQEIQLWDKATYMAALEEEFTPLNEFLSKLMAQSMEMIFSEKAISGHEKMTLDLTRFSTLDGDKKFTLTLEADYIVQKGVMDVTLTFDVANLLKLFTPEELNRMAQNGGSFDLQKLTTLLTGGKAEFILDYNTGEVAWNVPLLALVDETMTGWQSQSVPGLADFQETVAELGEFSLTDILYSQMTASAQYRGAMLAAQSYDTSADILSLFLGKDRFSTDSRGRLVYSLTTQEMNEALSRRFVETTLGSGTEGLAYSFFKSFDLRYTMDEHGNITSEMHIRPDKEGIALAMADSTGTQDGATASLVSRLVLSLLDMELTASAEGNQSRATEEMEFHWNNMGKLSLRATATTKAAKSSPRSINEIINKD